ncbi:hypothetical protein EDD17DRAFT_1514892 [Pisolithus thermaeus]|nr:hypothetical protein EV401DRAFT_1896200 [Pisolithus croceorrhizus]KAI6145671.1 hypothetical protein EDD17DRAFT_1514892 [Pisolithus thermaeus]
MCHLQCLLTLIQFACMDAEGISQVPLREVTAGLVTEEVVQMLRMDNLSPLYSTPHRHKGNSRKHRQLAAVKDEIMSGKEQNNNLASNRDFLSFKSPLHEVVMSFAEGSGPGPDPINLQWDFSSPVSSVWNQAVVNILLNKLHELGMEEQWATTPRSNEYWKEAIKQKFNWIKVMWNKGRPWRLKNDILETPAEVAARLMQEKMKDLKMVQKDMHRVVASLLAVLVSSVLQNVQKFCCCSITTKTFLCMELAQGTKDKDVWQWLSCIVEYLGTYGMSSEDSEEEDIQTIV